MIRLRDIPAAIALAALAGCGAPSPSAEQLAFEMSRPDAVLLVTGGTNGTMEVCDCAGPMPGGLARRSGLFRAYRSAFRNVVAVDTGDLFWVNPADPRHPFILQGYEQLGYDAVVLADQEWTVPPQRLSKALAAADLAYLSTDVRSPSPEVDRAVREQVVKRWPGGGLAVVSATEPIAYHFVPAERKEALSFVPLERVAARIEHLKAEGLTVVCVAHGTREFADRVAGSTAADVVLRGHTTRTAEVLRRVDGTPIVKAGGNEHVTVLALAVGPGGNVRRVGHRVEQVDERWPLDRRLLETFQEALEYQRQEEKLAE